MIYRLALYKTLLPFNFLCLKSPILSPPYSYDGNFTGLSLIHVQGYSSGESTLRLHPDTLDHEHVENLEVFTQDLKRALDGTFPRDAYPYSSVNVLLLSWEADDLDVASEISQLRRVFEWHFRFKAEEWRIPSGPNPTRALQDKLYAFQDAHQSEQELLIVYYAGHGEADPRRGRSIWRA